MVKRFKTPEGKQLLYESYEKLIKLCGVEIEEIDIETQYGKTHIIVTGNKANPPLLLFHGSGDNSVMTWFPNIKEFAKNYYVVAVDYFGGAGKSEPNDKFLKEFDVVIWVNRILDSLGIKKTNVAGLSYGGYLTLAYTANNPDRVNKIICIANYPYLRNIKGYLLFFITALRTIRVLFPEIINVSEEKAIHIMQKYSSPNCIISDNLNKELAQHWFYIFKHSSVIVQRITYLDNDALKVFKEKALFLIGDSDKLMYHPSVLKIFKDNDINFKIISNCGHVVNYEKPGIINEEFNNFLLK